jgi:hypothetical protein
MRGIWNCVAERPNLYVAENRKRYKQQKKNSGVAGGFPNQAQPSFSRRRVDLQEVQPHDPVKIGRVGHRLRARRWEHPLHAGTPPKTKCFNSSRAFATFGPRYRVSLLSGLVLWASRNLPCVLT